MTHSKFLCSVLTLITAMLLFSCESTSGPDNQSGSSSSSENSLPYSSQTGLSSSSSVTLFSSSVFASSFNEIVYGSVTDNRDNQVYQTVRIGSQNWMAENLNYEVENSWCYKDQAEHCTQYGRLYAWIAAMQISQEYERNLWNGSDVEYQGICPAGWHVPSDMEWYSLGAYISQQTGQGLFESGSWSQISYLLRSEQGWDLDLQGSNLFGFSALPGGIKMGSFFYYSTWLSSWWSSTEKAEQDAYGWTISEDFQAEFFYRDSLMGKNGGASVRCIENILAGPGSSSSSSSSSLETDSTLTDNRNGQTYKIVTIGSQKWMAENLNYAVDSSWCYNNEADSCAKYGRLYLWVTAMEIDTEYTHMTWSYDENHQGICPDGWHLPNNEEWQTLYDYATDNRLSEAGAGTTLKSMSDWEYDEDIETGTDRFHFSALPGGYLLNQSYFDVGKKASFWSASSPPFSSDFASQWSLFSTSQDFVSFNSGKEQKFSVRCIKNSL